jgi:hypothetical protein
MRAINRQVFDSQMFAATATPWRLAASTVFVATMGWVGCSSPTKPEPPLPTLLVTNATCAGGTCRTLQLRASVWAFPVPQVPPGFKVVAEVHTPTACIVFPKSWTLSVETAGSTDTTFYTWTPDNSSGITLFAVDSVLFNTGGTAAQRDSSNQALWPYDGAAPFTVGYATFVPGSAAGWSVTYPSTLQSGLVAPGLTVAAACTP